MKLKWMDVQSDVFAPVWIWVCCMGSTAHPQGIHAVKSRASSLVPKFSSTHNSLGRAVSDG